MHRSDDGGDTWQVIEDGLPVAELSDGHHCSFGFPSAMDRSTGNVFVVPLDGDNFRFPARRPARRLSHAVRPHAGKR